MMLTPTFSSAGISPRLSKPRLARTRATPPPGTMPSSTAERVAERASSTLALRSFSSISVAAPTLITATPPDSLAIRSWSFSRSNSEVVSSIWALIWLMRPWMSASEPLPSTMVASSLVAVMLRAEPKSSMVAVSSFCPVSSLITAPPVRMAMSSSMALRRSPKPGALIARTLRVPRSLLTTKVARASPSTSSAMITTFFLPTWSSFSKAGSISATAEIFLSVMITVGSSITDSIRSGLVMK